MARKKMDFQFSVFNGHINDAHKRAMESLQGENPVWADEIRAAEAVGIMGIFDKPPTDATKRYVDLVTEYVNEDAED